jgi:hypothetical protein
MEAADTATWQTEESDMNRIWDATMNNARHKRLVGNIEDEGEQKSTTRLRQTCVAPPLCREGRISKEEFGKIRTSLTSTWMSQL